MSSSVLELEIMSFSRCLSVAKGNRERGGQQDSRWIPAVLSFNLLLKQHETKRTGVKQFILLKNGSSYVFSCSPGFPCHAVSNFEAILSNLLACGLAPNHGLQFGCHISSPTTIQIWGSKDHHWLYCFCRSYIGGQAVAVKAMLMISLGLYTTQIWPILIEWGWS
jgi:hypothetical protein